MLMNEMVKATGHLSIEIFSSSGLLKEKVNVPNLVVTTGRNYIASRMISATSSIMSHMAVGTGTTAPAIANTVLETEIARVALDSQSVANTIAAYDQTFVVTTVPNPEGAGNIYQIDGVNKPMLTFVRGGVYTFDQSDASNTNHPIAFKDGDGNSYTDGVVSTGTPGEAGAQTVFTVPTSAPADLRYYCTVHGNGMGNTISVGNNVITYVATYGATVGTGAITEAGIFNVADANLGTMLCRTTFGVVTKAVDDIMIITWNVTIS